jgi:hypothetical protein
MTQDERDSILKLTGQVSGLIARFDAMEKARTEARKDDAKWRERIEGKVDTLTSAVGDMPCVMDTKIAACREEREAVTGPAVEAATKRRVLAGVAGSGRSIILTLVPVAALVISLVALFLRG